MQTEIADVFVLERKEFIDARGFFMESYNKKTFRDFEIIFDFLQDNRS